MPRQCRHTYHAILGLNQYHTNTLWEVDHIIPVCEGGGACGLDNLRTLCLWCHRKETAKLAARRAQRRRRKPEPTVAPKQVKTSLKKRKLPRGSLKQRARRR